MAGRLRPRPRGRALRPVGGRASLTRSPHGGGMATRRRARRRPAKRGWSLTLTRLSELDLENVAQVELRNYFEIRHPQLEELDGARSRGSQVGRTSAAGFDGGPDVQARILFELERLIRRAHREAARAAALEAHAREEH